MPPGNRLEALRGDRGGSYSIRYELDIAAHDKAEALRAIRPHEVA